MTTEIIVPEPITLAICSALALWLMRACQSLNILILSFQQLDPQINPHLVTSNPSWTMLTKSRPGLHPPKNHPKTIAPLDLNPPSAPRLVCVSQRLSNQLWHASRLAGPGGVEMCFPEIGYGYAVPLKARHGKSIQKRMKTTINLQK